MKFIWASFFVLMLKLMVWLPLVLLISIQCTSVPALALGILLYFVSAFQHYVRFAATGGNLVSRLFSFILRILPNLDYFSVENAMVHTIKVPYDYWMYLLFYTAGYACFALCLSCILFSRKDL